jgi:hypothetical protein
MDSKRLLSLTNQTKQNPGNKQHLKIELMVCQAGGQSCKEHLSLINECYLEAGYCHFEKDYLNSIELLKCAFFKTTDLNQDSCVNCAKFFRSTIAQSLENINNELHILTTGLFSKKRYQKCYIASRDVLNEIRMGL